MGKIVVLRIGHRPERDHRVTTHVGLVSRALGADGMLLAGGDRSVEESIMDVVTRWGGSFTVSSVDSWKSAVKKWKQNGGIVCHLTMYGINISDVIDDIRKAHMGERDILIIVGAGKVPFEVYELSDWNIAVTNQPHSEIAALAIFLDRLQDGTGLERVIEGAELKIIPRDRGKEFADTDGVNGG